MYVFMQGWMRDSSSACDPECLSAKPYVPVMNMLSVSQCGCTGTRYFLFQAIIIHQISQRARRAVTLVVRVRVLFLFVFSCFVPAFFFLLQKCTRAIADWSNTPFFVVKILVLSQIQDVLYGSHTPGQPSGRPPERLKDCCWCI